MMRGMTTDIVTFPRMNDRDNSALHFTRSRGSGRAGMPLIKNAFLI